MDDCCCLWASWLSTADGSGWSFISTEENGDKYMYSYYYCTAVNCTSCIIVIKNNCLRFNSHVFNFCVEFLIYFEKNLQCWAVTGPFSTLWALTSTEGEEAGAGFCIGGGPASLETLLMLVVANVWLALWPSRGPLSCSDVLTSETGVGLGAFRDPKPEPRTED